MKNEKKKAGQVFGKQKQDLELKLDLELDPSMKGSDEVWVAGELELWQKCLLLAGGVGCLPPH